MLKISETVFAQLRRDEFMRRVHQFLLERSADAGYRELLAQPEFCRQLWAPHFDDVREIDEHTLALRLAFVLACIARDVPVQAPLVGEDGELAAKSQLNNWGILMFSAFDL